MDETSFSRQRQQAFAFASQRLLHPGTAPGGFETVEGEYCVPLAPLWEALFADLEALGPVACISHNRGVMLGATLPAAVFLPVPRSEEFVELHTGQVIDSAPLVSALAVEEMKCGGSLFSLQFFDAAGRGECKLLLTTEANLPHFLEIVQHYAIGGDWGEPADAPGVPLPTGQPLVPITAADARKWWPHLRHATPGRWLAGRPGVSRLDLLAPLGSATAAQVSFDSLIRVMLAARRGAWPLTFGLDRRDLRQEATLVPRWIESHGETLHLFDCGAEVHLFPEYGGTIWRVCWGQEWVLEWFDPAGERLLTVRGPQAEFSGWNPFLATLS